jgi:hypothetical protein
LLALSLLVVFAHGLLLKCTAQTYLFMECFSDLGHLGYQPPVDPVVLYACDTFKSNELPVKR